MRIFITLILAISFTISAQAQTRSINSFYNKYRFKKDVFNASIPGWLVRMGVGIGKTYTDDVDGAHAAMDMAKKVRKLKLMVMEDMNLVKSKDFKKLIHGVRKDGFEELMTVRDEGTKINIFIREKKDEIRNMLILVNEPEEFMMLSLKTKLTMDEVNEFIQEMSEMDML